MIISDIQSLLDGISLYLQGTHLEALVEEKGQRYIPVPTGNSSSFERNGLRLTVYPCTYRELGTLFNSTEKGTGISLYLQGTL